MGRGGRRECYCRGRVQGNVPGMPEPPQPRVCASSQRSPVPGVRNCWRGERLLTKPSWAPSPSALMLPFPVRETEAAPLGLVSAGESTLPGRQGLGTPRSLERSHGWQTVSRSESQEQSAGHHCSQDSCAQERLEVVDNRPLFLMVTEDRDFTQRFLEAGRQASS